MIKLSLKILAVVATLTVTTLAQMTFDYFKVQRDMFAGMAGDTEAFKRAMEACEKALVENPNQPHALVWHGIGTLVQAGQNPQQSAARRERALAEMDRAVTLGPSDPGVRIPRGAVIMAVARQMPDSPARRELLERSSGDFQFVFDMQNRAGLLDTIGNHPLGELLQGLGDVYSRQGKPQEARKYYEMIQVKLPNTEYARRAAQWLETRQPLPIAQTACIGCHTANPL